MSDSFYYENEEWVDDPDGKCSEWLNELFKRRKTPTEASLIIERAFKLYKL